MALQSLALFGRIAVYFPSVFCQIQLMQTKSEKSVFMVNFVNDLVHIFIVVV